ncbi:MAG TPA: LacI family DNA-binding transcriptional regulator [Bacteroidota bacterium]|nr:LacI family DNA-binding transcriptional regulator [Bacteroidota bacterium]
MRATIKDVAKKAGVSIATVSRVFNNSPLVQEKTKAIVQEAARSFSYIPNPSARSLSTRRTETLGVLLPDLHGEFFSEVIRGMDQTARKHRYHLLISSSHNNKSEIAAALGVMRGRVDGLIIMSPNIDAHTLNTNLPSSLPLVLLNCSIEDNSFDTFNIDNFNGAREAVLHLIGHGHRRIAVIKGTEGNIDARERLRGYLSALESAGISRAPELEFEGMFTEISGYQAVEPILQLRPRPSAIFASNDSMAIGAMSALETFGVAVPDDLALAGFDDTPIARFVNPALTTVHVDISNLGVQAVERLLTSVKEEHPRGRTQIVLPTRLVARESCGCKMRPANDVRNPQEETASLSAE